MASKATPSPFQQAAWRLALIEMFLPGLPVACFAGFGVNFSLPSSDCSFIELASKYVYQAAIGAVAAFFLACLIAGYAGERRTPDTAID
jgi:Na+-driven multidrug efflux pump